MTALKFVSLCLCKPYTTVPLRLIVLVCSQFCKGRWLDIVAMAAMCTEQVYWGKYCYWTFTECIFANQDMTTSAVHLIAKWKQAHNSTSCPLCYSLRTI